MQCFPSAIASHVVSEYPSKCLVSDLSFSSVKCSWDFSMLISLAYLSVCSTDRYTRHPLFCYYTFFFTLLSLQIFCLFDYLSHSLSLSLCYRWRHWLPSAVSHHHCCSLPLASCLTACWILLRFSTKRFLQPRWVNFQSPNKEKKSWKNYIYDSAYISQYFISSKEQIHQGLWQLLHLLCVHLQKLTFTALKNKTWVKSEKSITVDLLRGNKVWKCNKIIKQGGWQNNIEILQTCLIIKCVNLCPYYLILLG